ncbi:MAG TPA: 4Fe-4S dicluster domain-containing protein [Bacteroidia bacterium]|nr:4Fe-4S dicluster domain-containing protein [Bacteroidia bacterium]
MKDEKENSDRRNFLKFGLLAGGATLAGIGIQKNLSGEAPESGEKVKVLTADGKLVEVDSSHLQHHPAEAKMANLQAREGIEGKKFVMVIDLARCANARKCIEGCQKMHHKAPPVEWIKVKRMQDAEATAPYWMPQPCFHCDNPPCTKVCPVDATYKRKDGIVLIDNERCIGCRFCMAACPYNARSFNWGDKWGEAKDSTQTEDCCEYSPEKSFPAKTGTVEKCDFCPDMARQGKLPDCVTACPNGTIYYGDANDDTVSNGEEVLRLSEMLQKKGGYRYLEDLGTEPRVYYLPAVKRQFPFEEDLEKHNTEES